MKSKFPAYYRIHSEDLLSRFDDCIFMFDACTLLDIYRMKKEVTEDVFKVMDHLKEQIRIPYHVAEEYFDNIHKVLNTQITNINSSRSNFYSFIQALDSKRSQPYISKKAADLLIKLKAQVEKDFKEQEVYVKNQLICGEYQNRMNDLLNGKVLEPFTQQQLEEIKAEGGKGYEDKIPPGYKDADKTDNRYGDLINWKEILRFAKGSDKSIVIVSSETKEDWVIREQGCTIGLRYELLKEFYQTVSNKDQLLHFLSLDRFLELAREKDAHVVSERTVNEVKDYVKILTEYSSNKNPESEFRLAADDPAQVSHISTLWKIRVEDLKNTRVQFDPNVLQKISRVLAESNKMTISDGTKNNADDMLETLEKAKEETVVDDGNENSAKDKQG